MYCRLRNEGKISKKKWNKKIEDEIKWIQDYPQLSTPQNNQQYKRKRNRAINLTRTAYQQIQEIYVILN